MVGVYQVGSEAGKRPDYYYDSVKPVVNIGRGSPTGVAVYRHTGVSENIIMMLFFIVIGPLVRSMSRRPLASLKKLAFRLLILF